MRNGNIVEFPSGRLLVRPLTRCQTVAALVKRIATRSGLRPTARKRHPLTVALEDLTGVSDATINLLTSLAEGRVLSPASAARLAMRHTHEIGNRATDRPELRRHSRTAIISCWPATCSDASRFGSRSGRAAPGSPARRSPTSISCPKSARWMVRRSASFQASKDTRRLRSLSVCLSLIHI